MRRAYPLKFGGNCRVAARQFVDIGGVACDALEVDAVKLAIQGAVVANGRPAGGHRGE